LRASVQAVQPVTGAVKGFVGCAVLEAWGVVSVAKLPLTVGNAAGGGYIDANGQADLPHIHFAA